jgi:ABC-2 type transport system ATP-binding protein
VRPAATRLRVEEGEVFGFLGPNGACKTTTLKLLMGLVFPSGGSARILGMGINDPRMRAQIGFLPEQPYFYDYLRANELLEYYAQLSGVAAKEHRRKVVEVLSRTLITAWTALCSQLRFAQTAWDQWWD